MIWFKQEKTVGFAFFNLTAHQKLTFSSISEEKIPLLIAFSMYTNGQKLFATKRSRSDDTMDCLNGIRVFSALWVIYAHAHIMTLFSPVSNFAYVPEVSNFIKKNRHKICWLPEHVLSIQFKTRLKSLKMDHFSIIIYRSKKNINQFSVGITLYVNLCFARTIFCGFLSLSIWPFGYMVDAEAFE